MANDGSVFSEFEEYLATTIKAISPHFTNAEVRAYGGVPNWGGGTMQEVLQQIKGENVTPAVLINGTEVREKPSGANFEWDRQYICEVLIAHLNRREDGKAARMGESATDFGTHILIEKITDELHDTNPAASVDSGLSKMHQILVGNARALTMEAGYSVWQLTIKGEGAFNTP